jgi:putative transposase
MALPARSPNLNAFADRWVRSAKREECLSKSILFDEGPLSRTLTEFSAHYHGELHHQGKGNKLLSPEVADKAEERGY